MVGKQQQKTAGKDSPAVRDSQTGVFSYSCTTGPTAGEPTFQRCDYLQKKSILVLKRGLSGEGQYGIIARGQKET